MFNQFIRPVRSCALTGVEQQQTLHAGTETLTNGVTFPQLRLMNNRALAALRHCQQKHRPPPDKVCGLGVPGALLDTSLSSLVKMPAGLVLPGVHKELTPPCYSAPATQVSAEFPWRNFFAGSHPQSIQSTAPRSSFSVGVGQST